MTQGDYIVTKWTHGTDDQQKAWKFCRIISPLVDGNITETVARVEPDAGEEEMNTELTRAINSMSEYHQNYAPTIEQ